MRLSENGYFPQSLRQAQIIILEILKCIPVVIIFAFLDLGKKYLILRQPPSTSRRQQNDPPTIIWIFSKIEAYWKEGTCCLASSKFCSTLTKC